MRVNVELTVEEIEALLSRSDDDGHLATAEHKLHTARAMAETAEREAREMLAEIVNDPEMPLASRQRTATWLNKMADEEIVEVPTE